MQPRRIALVAHDNMKAALIAWAEFNRDSLANHELIATGTTGTLVEQRLNVPLLPGSLGASTPRS